MDPNENLARQLRLASVIIQNEHISKPGSGKPRMRLYDVTALVGGHRTTVRVRAYDVPHALSLVWLELSDGIVSVVWEHCARV